MALHPDLPRVVAAMRAGGYWDRVMSGGPDLERVQVWLRRLAGELDAPTDVALQAPTYPCFPGLEHAPFHDGAQPAATAALEGAFETILAETLALPADAPRRYTATAPRGGVLGRIKDLIKPRWIARGWTVHLFHHMGVDFGPGDGRCERTRATIASLPRVCTDHPWGEALLSIQQPGSSLPPHCSVDNLRLRCHLGLRIPDGAGIRVGREERTWSEGRCLWFEDSIEHEVWNRGESARLVLIVDLWHPGLTDVETRAITAGFRKAEVRRVFMHSRVAHLDAPDALRTYVEAEIARQESDPLLREYWG
ncbi:MAG: aspartyl/asparaginyl beta-hydroxylase domain-containing protein [Planctomycetota bacterium]